MAGFAAMTAPPIAPASLGPNLHPDVAKLVLAARIEARRLGEPDPFPRVPLETIGAKRRRVVELADWFTRAGEAAGWLLRLRSLGPGNVTIARPADWIWLRTELVRVDHAFAGLGLITACDLIAKSPYTTAARWAREVSVLGTEALSELAAAKAFRDDTREPRRSKRLRERRAKE
jgi:hypothetical protein